MEMEAQQTDSAVDESRDDQRGQGMTEYALIIVLIGVVVVFVVGIIGHQVQNVFSNVSSGMSG